MLMSRSASRFVRLARACNRHRRRTFGAWLLALVVIQIVASNVGAKQSASLRLPAGTLRASRTRSAPAGGSLGTGGSASRR
jgi:hypothetical protein